MVAPHELRKRDFTRVMRGYSPSEVDEFISYLIKNYVELYREKTELEKRIDGLISANNELSRDSRAVKTALVEAQHAAEQIVNDAREESDMIVASAKRNCDNVLNEFRALVAQERTKLVAVQNAVAEFKSKLFSDYQDHIDRIQEITETADIPFDDEDYDEVVTRRIVTDIKSDAAQWAKEHRAYEEPAENPDDAPDPESYEAANIAENTEMTGEAAVDEVIEYAGEIEADEEPIDLPETDPSATRTFDPVSDGDAVKEFALELDGALEEDDDEDEEEFE